MAANDRQPEDKEGNRGVSDPPKTMTSKARQQLIKKVKSGLSHPPRKIMASKGVNKEGKSRVFQSDLRYRGGVKRKTRVWLGNATRAYDKAAAAFRFRGSNARTIFSQAVTIAVAGKQCPTVKVESSGVASDGIPYAVPLVLGLGRQLPHAVQSWPSLEGHALGESLLALKPPATSRAGSDSGFNPVCPSH